MNTKITIIGGGIIILFIILSFISDFFYTKKILNNIYDNAGIQRITVDEHGIDLNNDKHFEISDSLILKKIDYQFRHSKEIDPKGLKVHSELLDIILFKNNKKIDIEAVKTEYDGWVIVMGTDNFKNDSLINLLIK